MNEQQTYSLCCQATADLLEALEQGNLARVEKQVRLLRSYLSEWRPPGPVRCAGEALLRAEQLEALEGVAEEMERSLRTLHRTARFEMEQLASHRGLLRHLTGVNGPGAPQLPVC